MKILVLSDSHAGLSLMRRCVEKVEPAAIVHLGDYYDDGQIIAQEHPSISFYQVPGNCDRNRGWIPDPEIKIEKICGIWAYLTHGHRHSVKQGLYSLLADARAAKAQVVLFGHTHSAVCYEEDGMWVLNPGACGSWGGSCGVIEVERGIIQRCYLLRAEDL